MAWSHLYYYPILLAFVYVHNIVCWAASHKATMFALAYMFICCPWEDKAAGKLVGYSSCLCIPSRLDADGVLQCIWDTFHFLVCRLDKKSLVVEFQSLDWHGSMASCNCPCSAHGSMIVDIVLLIKPTSMENWHNFLPKIHIVMLSFISY